MQTAADSWWGSQSPDYITTYTILSKRYSTYMDTIYYMRKVDIYTIYHHVEDSSRYETKIDTLVVSNLNDTILPANSSSSCFTLNNSFFTNSCGNNVWLISPVSDTSCWHAFAEETWYIEGLGGHYSSSTNETGETKECNLVYYKKSTDSCGTLWTGVEENRHRDLIFNIYPNPVNDQIRINSEVKLAYFNIFNCQGEKVLSGQLNEYSIDVNVLNTGMYIINFYTNNNKNVTRKFTKQ